MGRATEYLAYLNDTGISERDNSMVYLSFDDTIKRQRYEYQKNLKILLVEKDKLKGLSGYK